MLEFKNVVLTTDFSSNAEAASAYAAELARRHNGRIHLVHVFEDVTYYMTVAEDVSAVALADPAGWYALAKTEHENKLSLAATKLSAQENIEVVPVFRQGHTAREIVDYAKQVNADAIVIATHGRTGLSHFIFGSVAERVLRLSHCPVLSVRPEKMKTR